MHPVNSSPSVSPSLLDLDGEKKGSRSSGYPEKRKEEGWINNKLSVNLGVSPKFIEIKPYFLNGSVNFYGRFGLLHATLWKNSLKQPKSLVQLHPGEALFPDHTSAPEQLHQKYESSATRWPHDRSRWSSRFYLLPGILLRTCVMPPSLLFLMPHLLSWLGQKFEARWRLAHVLPHPRVPGPWSTPLCGLCSYSLSLRRLSNLWLTLMTRSFPLPSTEQGRCSKV